jgi:RNA polymerase sigma-70 factor (ECF subfamily)
MPGDQERWNKLSAGDADAFEGFYRAYAARVCSFLRVRLPSRQAAEDVTQETFLQLWRRPNGFNPSQGNLKTYVFGMARKRAADWWRHHPSGDQPTTQCSTTDNGVPTMVRDAFGRLDQDARSLLWLREVEGYSY